MTEISKKWLLIVGALLIFIAAHLFFILTSQYTFFDEEQNVATIGLDLLNGKLQLPFWYYLDSPHSGGSMFAGLLAVPFYLIFGKSYLALKLAAIALNLGTFVFLIFILTKKYGGKILLPLVTFFAISTPGYLYRSLIFFGNIEPPVFITLISLLLLLFYIQDKKKNRIYPIALGFLSGFGLWLQYGQIIVIAEILFFLFLLDRRFFLRRDFLYFLLFFLIGFSPFIIYNLSYDFVSFTADPMLLDSDFFLTQLGIGGFLSRLEKLFISYLPRSFQIPSFLFISAKTLGIVFYMVTLFFVGVALWMEKKPKKLTWVVLLTTYLIFASLFINLANVPKGVITGWGAIYVHGYYYIIFFQPFLFILASIGIVQFLEQRKVWKKILGWLGLAMISFIVIGGFSQIVRFNKYNSFLEEPIGEIGANASETGYSFSRNIKLFDRELDRLSDPEIRFSFIMGAGQSWNLILRSQTIDQERLQSLLPKMEEYEKTVFFRELIKGPDYLEPTQQSVFGNYKQILPLLSADNQELLSESLRLALERVAR
ncbi:glycosyltransferase family 39 protein [Patescibacteria group bacterium]|nr:glycosyltransferase family 39 protein [Patescibacteria group bacterium]